MAEEPLAPFPTRYAPTGMVASADHLASGAGVAVLRAGGNAVDAAIAANAVLAVTSPHLCGLGGDLFALVHEPGMPAPAVLNASGRAGSGADPARLRAEGHSTMPFTRDVRAVTVPGCADGWVALSARFGRMPLADVLAPAFTYAEQGFPCSATLAAMANGLFPGPGTEDLTGSGRRRAGQAVRRPGVARALVAIGRDGRDGFYGGPFGEGLRHLGAAGGGEPEFNDADLARPQAEWVDALGVPAWGLDVWTAPPGSQGYLALAGAWVAQGLDLPGGPDGPDDAAWAHLLVEASRQVAFDRVDALYDGADGAALVAPDRLAARRDAIDPARATPLGVRASPGDTTYLCAVDADRMAVSLIQSNASGFGSLLWEPSTGINLHNRGHGFSLVAGHPAEYGPGRRPPHTLSPVLVTHPDRTPAAVVGTMGGDAQPQVVLQVLARLVANAQSPGRAIASGRFALGPATGTGSHPGFETWAGRGAVSVRVEARCPPGWAQGLTDRGHDVTVSPAFDHGFGHANLIVVAGDHLAGAADPRARAAGVAGY